MTVRWDRRRWIYYGAALVSMVVLWWLLMVLGVPGEVMQYGMFAVNFPAVVLVLLAHRYPRVRQFTCPGCGARRTQPVPKGRERSARRDEPAAVLAPKPPA
jgi:hypothetical protein